jgi:MFS transporter, DHA1 family, multidrug resistance protein
MLGRFISGFAAAGPISTMGGIVADMCDPIQTAYAICILAVGGFGGPAIAPVVSKKCPSYRGLASLRLFDQVGGFITQSYLGWRWTAWITMIAGAFFGLIGLFVIPETSAPRILQMKAKRLRHQTKNWALHARADEHQVTLQTISQVYLVRPFVMIVQEPILALMSVYLSYIYGIIYLFFGAVRRLLAGGNPKTGR